MAIRVTPKELFIIFFVCAASGALIVIVASFWIRRKLQLTKSDALCENLGSFLRNWALLNEKRLAQRLGENFIQSFNEQLQIKFKSVFGESQNFSLESDIKITGEANLKVESVSITSDKLCIKAILRLGDWSQSAYQMQRSGNQLTSTKSQLQLLNIQAPITICWMLNEENLQLHFQNNICFSLNIFPKCFEIEDLFKESLQNVKVTIPFHFEYSQKIQQYAIDQYSKTTEKVLIPTNVLIRIIKANGLIDSAGSEQYCVISMDEPQQLHISSSVEGSAHPFFDEKFTFSINENTKEILFEMWASGDIEKRLLGETRHILNVESLFEKRRYILPLKAQVLCSGSLTIELSGTNEMPLRVLSKQENKKLNNHLLKEGSQNEDLLKEELPNESLPNKRLPAEGLPKDKLLKDAVLKKDLEVPVVKLISTQEKVEGQKDSKLKIIESELKRQVETSKTLSALPPPGFAKPRGMMSRIKRRFHKKDKGEGRSKSVEPPLGSRRPFYDPILGQGQSEEFLEPNSNTLNLNSRSIAVMDDAVLESSPDNQRSRSVTSSLRNLFRKSQANISWKSSPSPTLQKHFESPPCRKTTRPLSNTSTDSGEETLLK